MFLAPPDIHVCDVKSVIKRIIQKAENTVQFLRFRRTRRSFRLKLKKKRVAYFFFRNVSAGEKTT